MGNQKFKLSDMIPNAWFYKLKYMGTRTTAHHSSPPPPLPTKKNHSNSSTTKSKPVAPAAKQQQPYQLSQPRKSYHITRELNDPKSKISDSYNYNHIPPDPPRKSAKRRSTKRKSTPTTVTTTRYSSSLSSCSSPSSHKLVNSSVSTSGCSSGAPVDSFRPKYGSPPPPPSPIHDSESDHFSTMPQFSPPDHSLLSDSETTLHPTEGGGRPCYSTNCTCKLEPNTFAAATDDVVIDVDEKSLAMKDGKSTVVVTDGLDSISHLVELPPILTKKTTKPNQFKTRDSIDESSVKYKRTSNLIAARKNINNGSLSSLKSIHSEENNSNFKGNYTKKIRTPTRKFVVSSPGVSVGLKLRLSSPRIGRKLSAGGAAIGSSGRKSISGGSRKSISESFAIVKSSFDPYKDFKESMVEMIVENNIQDSKELEELLAAYLSLNSEDYHGVIINVFKQIWFDLNNIKGRQRKVVV